MLHLTLSNERQKQNVQHPRGPLEFGRGPQREVVRVIVEDRYVSRDQLRLEELSTGRVRVLNLGAPMLLGDGSSFDTGETRELASPFRLTFGYSTLDVEREVPIEDYGPSLQSIAPPAKRAPMALAKSTIDVHGAPPSPDTLASWFERLLLVQRAAAGSGEFYQETARAVVSLVGLDRGMIVLRRDDRWEVVACHTARRGLGSDFSQRVLQQVVNDERTFFQVFDEATSSHSLKGVEAVVASPIFDEREAVVGAVYGSRDLRPQGSPTGIHPLEAQFVQLLAGAVSAGLLRLQREADAARTRVMFEQFFSPELVRALERDSRLLEGQERELTILFTDLRGFSRISEQVGVRETYALLSDVMDHLTNRVLEQGGAIIDYYGDGMAAMWNAPADQPDHAERACRAGLAMLSDLPALNERWTQALGFPLRIGVGIHSGRARVGNAGSRHRLKYGPRGHAVNLASRVEGTTKLLGVPCIITEATHGRLPDEFHRRRLCMVQVTGIRDRVELYELRQEASESWLKQRELYEAALNAFHQADFAGCLERCQGLTREFGESDPPTVQLAQHAARCIEHPPAQFDPCVYLDTKG